MKKRKKSKSKYRSNNQKHIKSKYITNQEEILFRITKETNVATIYQIRKVIYNYILLPNGVTPIA